MTRSFGNCERLLINVSAIPSLRYSSDGSPVPLMNGRTARESTSLRGWRPRSTIAAAIVTITIAMPAAIHKVRREMRGSTWPLALAMAATHVHQVDLDLVRRLIAAVE